MYQCDQSEVEGIVKRSGSSFYWGMKILPKDQARAMFSIYAFCRVVDDFADEIKNKKIRERLLKKWELSINNSLKQKLQKMR